MAKGIKIGDQVAITATVPRRVTEGRVSVSILSYGFPHSIVDKTSTVKKGQPIGLISDVTQRAGRSTRSGRRMATTTGLAAPPRP
ncbi:MAG: hypothetical protein EOS22_07185 [Mesorhizobium sp.]|nr:MAG: hypothetical protein EOS22_07185 [Mesorhizobium sp.]TJW71154.1 MAG: hypothetical protein E5V29_01035 [Mesorhizobium sp.]